MGEKWITLGEVSRILGISRTAVLARTRRQVRPLQTYRARGPDGTVLSGFPMLFDREDVHYEADAHPVKRTTEQDARALYSRLTADEQGRVTLEQLMELVEASKKKRREG